MPRDYREVGLCQLLLVSQIITRLYSSQRKFASIAKSWLKKEKVSDLFIRTLFHLIKKLKIVYNTISSFVRILLKIRSEYTTLASDCSAQTFLFI